MKHIRSGDYIVYDNKENGTGKAKVIDIVETKGIKYAIVEPLYRENEKRLKEVFIKVRMSDIKASTDDEIAKRICRR